MEINKYDCFFMKDGKSNWPLVIIVGMLLFFIIKGTGDYLNKPKEVIVKEPEPSYWVAPSLFIDESEGFDREQLIYGADIIAHTSRYFGPQGTVLPISNGMNCQNCHLGAGTKAWGNNYGAVYATYPKFRDRSASIETIYKRVNDCFERSLNGKALDTNSKEMQAIYQYIKWLGKDVPKGEKPNGSGIVEVPYLSRAASSENGKTIYLSRCMSCHGANGEGVKEINGYGYSYPPLWGDNSYNNGAGLFRLSRFAGYVYDNMPFNQATHDNHSLSAEEAWDVAAFVNSQPRPQKDLSKDWPDISKKPVDHPFGPYADGFSEQQHKYGPFPPIIDARKKWAAQKDSAAKSVISKTK
jgi:thiosulfate dehydrogenase